MRENFWRTMENVFKFEGGYVDHPRDPGGATNMGITIGTLSRYLGRRATKNEVRNLPKEVALEIYRANYWNKVKGDLLPFGFDYVAMDGAVNSGPSRGVRWLQKAVGAKADGVAGPQTVARAKAASVAAISEACNQRMGFLRRLSTWDTFGRGWSRRVAHVEAVSIRMWSENYEDSDAAANRLGEAEAEAREQIASENAAGAGQTGATGGAGGAVLVLGDLPVTQAMIVGAAAFLVVVVLAVRSYKRSEYQKERAEAMRKQKEDIA